MKWKLAVYNGTVKSHFVPESLSKDIIDELYIRFLVSPVDIVDRDKALFDPGGMVMVDEEYLGLGMATKSDSFVLATRYSHFEYLYQQLLDSPLREVNGKQYYKLHGWLHCIVLLPEQFETYKKFCTDNLEKINEKVISSHVEFEKRMKQINKNKEVIQYTKRIKLPEENN